MVTDWTKGEGMCMQINRQKRESNDVGRRSVGTTKKSDTVKGADLPSEGPASKHNYYYH
jgi:hypothetical protein